MVNFILSLEYLLYTLFYQIVLQLSKGGEKRKKESGVQLMFFSAETPVKDWCQEPKTSPLFQVFSGIMRETKHHHALVIIKQNTRRREYSEDLPS